MEFRQLEAFTIVAEQKSFSKAADYLYLSQSTVSSHIKNLEKELQKTLIVRTTKSLQLTPEGEVFLRYAKRIMETKDAAVDAVSNASQSTLHLGASTIPSGYLLPEILNKFHKLHPHTCFNIKQGDSMEIHDRILDGTIELGLIGEKSPSSKCISVPFCTDELILAVPADKYYTNLIKHNADISALLKEPVIMREQGSGTQKAADRILSEMKINRQQLNIVAQVNDLELIKQMIADGIGVSILSRFSVAGLEEQGRIITRPLQSTVERNFYITYLKSRNLTPTLKEFIDFVMHGHNTLGPE